MALIDLFFTTPKPGWQVRERGRKFVEVALTTVDIITEGLYQGRMALLGTSPPPDSIPYLARDSGIVAGVAELAEAYARRLRRMSWSWRAAGLPGVANVHVYPIPSDTVAIPTDVTGTPTEEGNVLRVLVGGTIGIAGITYEVSTDGGLTFPTSTVLGTSDTFVVGTMTVKFLAGQTIPAGDMVLNHGGFGLRLNDLGAPARNNIAASSQAGPEGILHEVAGILAPNIPRMRLVSANGVWWTREPNGYLWKLYGGPFAWEASKDSNPQWDKRGYLVIFAGDNIARWDAMGASSHVLGEPGAVFGTTTGVDYWNALTSTISNFKPADMLLVSVILCFDPTKFDAADPTTCPTGDWWDPVRHNADGSTEPSRPIDYAWFSTPIG